MTRALLTCLLYLGPAGHRPVLAQLPGTFTATGSMTTPRSGHTATLLTSGKVLIAGGSLGLNALATAELYDPDTGTFTRTGDMTAPRSRHTATLLPDGRVLIAGGAIDASAEVYDPGTGNFLATGNMTGAHSFHQATLLSNGKVLLTGGSDLNVVGARHAELYDPAAGTFATAGPYANDDFDFNTGQGAVSALLPDGRVLIIWETDHAELYDPVAGAFTATGKPMAEGYNDGLPTATLLTNGKVLVAGGADDTVVLPDRVGHTGAQLYDPLTESFGATGNLIMGHVLHTSNLLPDGTVLIAGNFLFPGESAYSELYDPATGTFTAAGSMLTPRGGGQTATLLNDGRVLITGGLSPYPSATSKAEVYRPGTVVAPPALLSVSGDGRGQGAILHAETSQIVTAGNPASSGEVLEIYCTGLKDGGVIPPRVTVGGRLAEILYFGKAPGWPDLNQVNVGVPGGIAPGPAVLVHLIYLDRHSNDVTIGVR